MAQCAAATAFSCAFSQPCCRRQGNGESRAWGVEAIDSCCMLVRSLGPSSGLANVHTGLRLLVPLRPLPVAVIGRSSRKLHFTVRAAGGDGQKNASSSSGFGLGGPGTWFGFGRKQERQVGRLAMIGFASALVMEVLTGKGIFGQLGLDPTVVRYPFLAGFVLLFVGGLLGSYVVIKNPPDVSKAPPNDGAGIKRDPLKTFDPDYLDPLTTYTRGGVVERPTGQKGREPYVSDLETPPKE